MCQIFADFNLLLMWLRRILLPISVSLALSGWARTIHVPSEAPTIQAGLDSLHDGDTVAVALGTYGEALIAPSLQFTLRGDVIPDTGDYPRPVIDPTPLPGSDSLTCLTLPAGSHPVVEDVVFRNGLAMYPHLRNDGGVTSYALDAIFRRIIMDSVIYALSSLSGDTTSTLTLESCQFRHVCQSGVHAASNAVHATDCLFSQNQALLLDCGSHSRIERCGFETDQNPGDFALTIHGSDIVVRNCAFTSSQLMLSPSVHVYSPRSGVLIVDNLFSGLDGWNAPVDIQYDDLAASTTITANEFANNHVSPFGLSGGIEFERYSWYDAPRMAMITDNLFADCSGLTEGGSNAIQLYYGAVLRGNHFWHLSPSAVPAIRLVELSSLDSVVQARENLFYETGNAFRNEVEAAMDARWNWWGDSTGPYHATENPGGRGDTIVGDVDFVPWYSDTSFLAVPGLGKPLPEKFVLEAYPNPFNSTVTLTLIPSQAVIVRVELFDILGRRVREIWSGPLAFEKRITFDGSHLSSGIYFVRVWQPIGNRKLALTKLVLLK